jgi:ribosome biogenesis GTPase
LSTKRSDFDSRADEQNRLLKNHAKAIRRQEEQKVIKKIKRNRAAAPPRHKDWVPDQLDDLANLDVLDDLDLPDRERIMPLGEASRRKSVLAQAATAIEDENVADDAVAPPLTTPISPVPIAEGVRGIVTEVGTSLCRVTARRRSYLCYLRGSLSAHDTAFTNVIAVGDQVIITPTPRTLNGVVEQVLPRRSALTRPDSFNSHLRQVIAANVDQVLIIASWRDPSVWPELLDRYLIAAVRNNLIPLICVNKIDLAQDRADCEAFMQPYEALGIQVLYASARTGEGIPELRTALSGQSTVLAGLSGVGKSSLLTAVQPGFDLRVGAVAERSGEGRHTTTQATLLPLGDGYVVDTPGIREFGLNGVTRADLIRFYPDLAAFAPGCRFRDCVHLDEINCRVHAAAESGEIAAIRYETYSKIARSLRG